MLKKSDKYIERSEKNMTHYKCVHETNKFV